MPDVTIGRYEIMIDSENIRRVSRNENVRPVGGVWNINDTNYGEIEFRKGGTLKITEAEYAAVLLAFGVTEGKAVSPTREIG